MKFNMKSLKRVLKRLKKYNLWIVLSVIFAAVSVMASLYIPLLVGDAIDFIIAEGKVDFGEIIKVFQKILISISVGAVLQWLMNTINNKITYEVVEDVRYQAIRKIQKLPLSYLDKTPAGDIVSRVIADVTEFADGLLLGFSNLFTGIVTIIVTLIFMLTRQVWIALLVVVLTPLSLLMARFIASRTHEMFALQSKTRGEQTAFINEMITNQKVVKAFGREDENVEKFDEINSRLRKTSLKATFFSSLTNPCTRFINSIIYAAVCLVGALLVLSGGPFTVGALSSFLSYANQYTKPFNEISSVITEFQNALACADRIFELTHDAPEEKDIDSVKTAEIENGTVELKNVSFSYTPEKKLIENLDLSVKKGQKIAIVGPTGCGKTTLINLLMRFYDVTAGEITVDSYKVKELYRQSLRKGFGMVLQDTWIKNGSVRENIAFGRPDATDDEIIAAAKASHAHSFIKRLPNGYDTVISDEGGALSQGQRQLLSISRVMLMDPAILILDEATSSIDTRTEMKIQDAFSKLMVGRTSFIVAHRLSTIMDADVILVMKDGNIVEKGSHRELLNKKGFYASLYNSQFS